jgi:hypothetical protein
MTLNVSLRVPDGIVIASDSLATVAQPLNQKVSVNTKCDNCGQQLEIKDVQVPAVSVPTSSWPYAQKLFPIPKNYGLAVFGWGFVNNRSMYNHILDFSSKLDPELEDFDTLAQALGDYFHEQLKIYLLKAGQQLELLPDNWSPFGFQFVGFAKDPNNDPVAKTKVLNVGKRVVITDFESLGCTCTGDRSVVEKVMGTENTEVNFGAFSLQDAIDFAKFLIRTTADFQRFSGKFPTVGGDIDIALVTNYRGFKWISQKSLYQILEKEEATL